MSEQDRAELAALSAALTKISTQIQEASALTRPRFTSLQTRLNIVLGVSGDDGEDFGQPTEAFTWRKSSETHSEIL